MSSPLTTAGDIWVYSTSNSRLPVGTNGQILVAKSTATNGVEWQTNTGGGDASMIYIAGASATTSGNTSVTVSNIPQTASDLIVIVQAQSTATSGQTMNIQYNASTVVGYTAWAYNTNGTISLAGYTNQLPQVAFTGPANTFLCSYIELNGYTTTTRKSMYFQSFGGDGSGANTYYVDGVASPSDTSAITSLVVKFPQAIGTNGFIYVDIWGAKRS